MAKIRYRRIPEPSLTDLSAIELTILDLAICALKDSLSKNIIAMDNIEVNAMNVLHDQILLIKKGEDISDR